jgi:uncharacterized protein YbjT (DUF2867 family)
MGLKIAKELALHGAFKVKAIIRQTTDEKKLSTFNVLRDVGIELVEANYDDIESLKSALNGVSVIVSALSREAVYQSQLNLITAAKEVGTITRFIPSEYGIDVPDDLSVGDPFRLISSKLAVRDALIASGVPYTIVITGVWLEYLITPFFNIDIQSKTVTTIGDGNFKVSSIHTSDFAKLLPRVILDENTINKKIYLVGNTITWNEIVALLDESFKVQFTKKRLTLDEVKAKIKTEQGMGALGSALQAYSYLGYDHFENPTNTQDNDLYSDITPLPFKQYIKSLGK